MRSRAQASPSLVIKDFRHPSDHHTTRAGRKSSAQAPAYDYGVALGLDLLPRGAKRKIFVYSASCRHALGSYWGKLWSTNPAHTMVG
jgi:hypothetical protein